MCFNCDVMCLIVKSGCVSTVTSCVLLLSQGVFQSCVICVESHVLTPEV